MKRFILFSLILFFLGACDKDPIPTLAPTITTGIASNIMNTTATVSLSITDISNSKEIGVLYGSSLAILASTDAQKGVIANFKSGNDSISLAGLSAGTTYYYKAYASDGTVFIYGDMKTFTTGIDYATLTTNSVSSITSTQATCGGNISSGGGSVTARGVCWNTSNNPTVSLTTKTVDGTGVGSFSSLLTGLTANTIYYVRAYATNEKGTAYGTQVNFTTLPISIPTITTTSVSSITATTAESGGNITDDGGATVTARGVCWSTTSNPTIANSITSDGTGTGSFTSLITGLKANTTYYVCAYATNSIGIAYGGQMSFTTTTLPSSGTFTDIDGNIYHFITIGTQVWMVENLKTTRYRNGEAIPNVTDSNTWGALITGAYCDYNNTPSNSVIYGKLYNWYTVNDIRNIAPIGWHVPSDTEWTALENYLIANGYNYDGSTTGNKIAKSLAANTYWWTSTYTGGIGNDLTKNNTSGFNALPGGDRTSDGSTFEYLGGNGEWWTSTMSSTGNAFAQELYFGDYPLITFWSTNGYGISIRCVRDY